jgi:hypothetical protein
MGEMRDLKLRTKRRALLVDSGCVAPRKMADLLDETRQLIAIFTTIDKNSKA